MPSTPAPPGPPPPHYRPPGMPPPQGTAGFGGLAGRPLPGTGGQPRQPDRGLGPGAATAIAVVTLLIGIVIGAYFLQLGLALASIGSLQFALIDITRGALTVLAGLWWGRGRASSSAAARTAPEGNNP